MSEPIQPHYGGSVSTSQHWSALLAVATRVVPHRSRKAHCPLNGFAKIVCRVLQGICQLCATFGLRRRHELELTGVRPELAEEGRSLDTQWFLLCSLAVGGGGGD